MQRQKRTARELYKLICAAVPALSRNPALPRKMQVIIGVGSDGEWFATVMANAPDRTDVLQGEVDAAVAALKVKYELV
jgi:hypothetical protein